MRKWNCVGAALVFLLSSDPALGQSAVSGSSAAPSSSAASGSATTKKPAISKSKSVRQYTAKASRKKSGAVTEARALEIIRMRADVQKLIDQVKNSRIKGSNVHVELDRKEGDDYIVHVYQFVPDGDSGEGHSATFNWFHVNAKTGKVSAEF